MMRDVIAPVGRSADWLRRPLTVFLAWTLALLLLVGFVSLAAAAPAAAEPLAPAATNTVATFQDGVDSYTGTRDTYLSSEVPLSATVRGGDATIIQDINTGDERRSLLLFDLSSIPTTATIDSAELQFYVDTEGQGFNMHRMFTSWDEATISYVSNGGHFAADGVDAEAAVDANWPGVDTYTGFITVTVPAATIQAWVDGTLANNGWLMIATHASDGQQLASREYGTVADRPKLTVAYTDSTVATSPPITPTNLAASLQSYDAIQLTWTDNVTNEANFELERSTTGSGGPFSNIATLPADSTSTVDAGLPLGSEHCYRLRATNSAGDSDYSNVACATTAVLASFQQDVNGYAGTIDTNIWGNSANEGVAQGNADFVQWDTDSSGGPRYGLLRFENLFQSEGGPIPNGTTIVSASVQYTVNNTGNSAEANEATSSWNEATTYLSFPGDPASQGANIATAAGSTTGPHSIDTTASIAAWASNPAANLGWIFDPNGTDGTQFRSREYTTVSERPKLDVYYIQSPPTTVPITPTNLAASVQSHDAIQLTWTDNVTNEANFELEHSTSGSGGPFAATATLPANSTSYVHTGLPLNQEYCYRLYASNAIGDSGYSNVACATTPATANWAIDFGGSNGWVSIPSAASLQLTTYTLETWFKKLGPGTPDTTGTGGIVNGLPLIAKGAAESESEALDINYYLGIDADTGAIAADFEEGFGGTSGSLNHPVRGTTVIQDGVWYHAAVTYDVTGTMRLYLNGNLETQLFIGEPVASGSNSNVSLATSLQSNGTTTRGVFEGIIDEARIWSRARSAAEIQATANSQIPGAQTDLLARYGLNENTGNSAGDTAGSAHNGTVMGTENTHWAWVAGAPFNINLAPQQPTNVSPANGAIDVPNPVTLEQTVTDPEGDPLEVSFYGRLLAGSSDFTIVTLPDTQFYSRNTGSAIVEMFISQTEWIVANTDSLNIVYVGSLGDMVDTAASTTQWDNAESALELLEDPITTLKTHGIPWGPNVGNHDQNPTGGGPSSDTSNFNAYFGESRFTGRDYYGGHYGAINNNNHYDTFSGGGCDFLVISLEYDSGGPATAVLDWADTLLKANPNRQGIVLVHHLMNTGNPGSFSSQGSNIWNALKDNPNLRLMHGGHVSGEGQRTDTADDGHTVPSLLADYQSRTNGGNGLLRIMTFSPSTNQISVQTYSPYADVYETDADSQFTLSYDMSDCWQLIGTNTNVPSGSTTSVVWTSLSASLAALAGTAAQTDGGLPAGQYEWFTTTSDGTSTTTSETSTFTAGEPAAFSLRQLAAGWNLVGLNIETEPATLAEMALDEITAQGGNVSELDRWLNGGWDAHLHDLPFNDFALELGRGYFFKAAGPSTWTRTGQPPASPVPVSLTPGWNLIGLPLLPSPMVAEDVLQEINTQGGNCIEIDRWFNGAWEGHPLGVIAVNNFNVLDDEGYFIQCSQASAYTPGLTLQQLARRPFGRPARPVKLPAVDSPTISDVVVSNRRDVALSITWLTDGPSDGWVEFGESGKLDQTARADNHTNTRAHQVTLSGLQPETTYRYLVHSGDTVSGPYEASTAATAAPARPLTIYGKVAAGDEAAAVGSVVIARLIDENGRTSEPLSTLVDGWGYWALSLDQAACSGSKLEIEVHAPAGAVTRQVRTCDGQAWPDLQLAPVAGGPSR